MKNQVGNIPDVMEAMDFCHTQIQSICCYLEELGHRCCDVINCVERAFKQYTPHLTRFERRHQSINILTGSCITDMIHSTLVINDPSYYKNNAQQSISAEIFPSFYKGKDGNGCLYDVVDNLISFAEVISTKLANILQPNSRLENAIGDLMENSNPYELPDNPTVVIFKGPYKDCTRSFTYFSINWCEIMRYISALQSYPSLESIIPKLTIENMISGCTTTPESMLRNIILGHRTNSVVSDYASFISMMILTREIILGSMRELDQYFRLETEEFSKHLMVKADFVMQQYDYMAYIAKQIILFADFIIQIADAVANNLGNTKHALDPYQK